MLFCGILHLLLDSGDSGIRSMPSIIIIAVDYPFTHDIRDSAEARRGVMVWFVGTKPFRPVRTIAGQRDVG